MAGRKTTRSVDECCQTSPAASFCLGGWCLRCCGWGWVARLGRRASIAPRMDRWMVSACFRRAGLARVGSAGCGGGCVCEFCVRVYVFVWFSVSVCVVARLRLNLCKHTQDLGFTCKFCGVGFSHVLRPHFLRRVRPCTIGYTRAWRELHACVRAVAQLCSNLLRAIIPMAWRALASLAVAVTAMCYVGGFAPRDAVHY